LLTWWLHAAIMLGGVALISRHVTSFAARDFLWKAALVGPLLTTTAHTLSNTVRRVDVAPMVRATMSRDATADPANTAAAIVGETSSESAEPAIGGIAPADATDWRSRFVTAWALVAGVLLLGLGIRRLRLMRSMGRREPVTDPELRRLLESLCLVANYPHEVKLTTSASLASPVALPGHEICVPQAVVTDLGREHQRGVLAHELAHLIRRDPLWLGLAQVMERVFFLQPLTWLARRELQVTAEYLCDDWAARQVGNGLPLARCLLTVAEWIADATGPVPEPAMAARGSHLLRRVERLVRGEGLLRDRGQRVGLAAGTVLVLATAVAVPAVIAGEPGTPATHEMAGPKAHGKTPPVAQDTVKSARVAALIAALKDSDAGVRAAAAEALGNLEHQSAATPLTDAMRDPDPQVRRAATLALADLEDPRAVPGLERLLTDTDADVRQEAASKLGEFDLTEAPQALLAALKDPNADVRHQAAHTAGEIGDARAVPGLKALLADPNKEVREAAVEALHEIGDPAALQALIDALKSSDPAVRKAAAAALGQKN
jgi:Zn-dependent protease with chaperone function